jgi:dephospho-CoA kinase
MTCVLGLTGSIGMGKSTTANFFRACGVPVHDSDAIVHALYAGEAAIAIEAAFPGSTRNGVVDREALGSRVLADAAALKKLEAIVHPLVRRAQKAFVDDNRARGAPVVVIDVPLLLETSGERRCDAVVVATAPADVQRTRVLARPGMTRQRFEAILEKQMPDAEKRRRAHFLVDSGRGFAAAERAVRDILRALAGRAGRRVAE